MLMWAIVAVLLLGAGGTGIYFATRGKGAKTVADARGPDPDEPDPDEPDKPDPDEPDRPDPDEPDKWDRKPDAAVDPSDDDPPDPSDDDPDVPTVPGNVVNVAQGVKIVAQPGMSVQRIEDGVVIGDITTFAILGAPITVRGNDPDAIARWYARSNKLKLMETRSGELLGATRKIYSFTGKINGVEFVQVGVPFLGPGYRVAVIVHMSKAAAQANPQGLEAAIVEVFTRRIILPSQSP
jgi:hypothetical protein